MALIENSNDPNDYIERKAKMHTRLKRELSYMIYSSPRGINFDRDYLDLFQWRIKISCSSAETIYGDEVFLLQIKFPKTYPNHKPEFKFIKDCIPVHPQIYSNGDINLPIVKDEWSPELTIQSICLSIQRMLTDCKEKRRPNDDEEYVQKCNEKLNSINNRN